MDFELKNLTAQAERRKMQQSAAEPPTQDHEDNEEITVDVEEQVPDDPAEQWSVTMGIHSDSFHIV